MKESFSKNSVVSALELQQLYKVLVAVIATLCLISVAQVTSAQSHWTEGQLHFQSLPSYPNQARNDTHYGVLNITNSTGTHQWQFDVTTQVISLAGGTCEGIYLNQNILRWLMFHVVGLGDFNFDIEAYNNLGNLVGRGYQQVSLSNNPLRDIQIYCDGQTPELQPHELLAELDINQRK